MILKMDHKIIDQRERVLLDYLNQTGFKKQKSLFKTEKNEINC